jgi:predicted nucleotidyltransferase
MDTEKRLAQRHTERAQLLAQAVALVENDPRIVAAWLFGSGHRGDADAFSDIDLWTVVDDAHVYALVAQRHAYVTQLGQPLLTLDVLGNAPVGGGYLMLQYPGSVGPIQVDWYWQPQAQSAIPDDAKLLFDRVGLPCAVGTKTIDVCYLAQGIQPPATATVPTLAQQLRYELTFCWCMSLIAAKYVARRAPEAATQLLHHAAQKLDNAQAILPHQATINFTQNSPRAAALSLSAVMSTLRQLHATAARLLPQLAALDSAMPPELLPAISRFYDLAEATSQLEQPSSYIRRS